MKRARQDAAFDEEACIRDVARVIRHHSGRMQEELTRAQLSAADLHKLLLSLMDRIRELANGPVPDTPPRPIPDTPPSAELEAESVPSSAVPSSLPSSVTQLHFEDADEGTGRTDAIRSSLGPTEFATPSAENSPPWGHTHTQCDGD